MAFPVDLLDNYSHDDLESSAEDYLSELRCGDPEKPELLSLINNIRIPICLSTVGFVPLYGGEERHKVLALFAPEDSLSAVALFLADQWWTIDDILRTSVLSREGLQQVKSIGERVVLYVLNRIIYRKQEIEKNEFPFLCHGSHDYAKILWKKGEAVGFYSVKPTGSMCSTFLTQSYQLPVLDTMFVRKKHRGKDFGLLMLEDFVDSFTEDTLGLRYPLTSFMHAACQKYSEKYPGDHDLLWEVEGVGHWHQRTLIASILQRETPKYMGSLQKESNSAQAEKSLLQCGVGLNTPNEEEALDPNDTQLSMDSHKNKDGIDVCEGTSEELNATLLSTRSRSGHLKRPKLGKRIPESDISEGEDVNISEALENRLEPPTRVSESSEELIEEREENVAECEPEELIENQKQLIQEVQQVSEKPDDKEESDVEPLNGELTEHAIKVSLVTEGETANEALDGESKLQSDSSEEATLTLLVPLILDPSEKSPEDSEDNMSDKVESMVDSEVPLEEEQVAAHRKRAFDHNADIITSSQKEEPSNNGLPNSVAPEAPEDAVPENISPNTASSLEEQSEGGSDSPEAPVTLGQGSLVMVELEDIAYQQHTEGQKNQLDEQSEESAEPASERAADSSSEEVEVEVPIIDRRTLRRKAKGYKGPPKKKGKLI